MKKGISFPPHGISSCLTTFISYKQHQFIPFLATSAKFISLQLSKYPFFNPRTRLDSSQSPNILPTSFPGSLILPPPGGHKYIVFKNCNGHFWKCMLTSIRNVKLYKKNALEHSVYHHCLCYFLNCDERPWESGWYSPYILLSQRSYTLLSPASHSSLKCMNKKAKNSKVYMPRCSWAIFFVCFG